LIYFAPFPLTPDFSLGEGETVLNSRNQIIANFIQR
jgi:hypothetical protein